MTNRNDRATVNRSDAMMERLLKKFPRVGESTRAMSFLAYPPAPYKGLWGRLSVCFHVGQYHVMFDGITLSACPLGGNCVSARRYTHSKDREGFGQWVRGERGEYTQPPDGFLDEIEGFLSR